MRILIAGTVAIATIAAMFAGTVFINVQRQAFGEVQATVLLVGEAVAFMCSITAIRHLRLSNLHLGVPLLWLGLGALLFSIAYTQLPQSRLERFRQRIDDQQKVLENYRRQYGQSAVCPPLDAELRARQLEAQAAQIRRANIYAFAAPFDAQVTGVGALSALFVGIITFLRDKPQRPN